MTKKHNNGSNNQSSPRGNQSAISGDNSKGNKRNKDQHAKTNND
ncbi:hypothetical protein ACFYKT_09780 [Cytobacillus sp. FJAT-53684]|uniref:Acid-soluble spore protein P n=1 Tax=Cytobacillus mangrovibacter TaxID=3299024 RepID=A0ABW6JYN1_9BACI